MVKETTERYKLNLLRKVHGKVFFDEPMRNHTSLRIGGPADCLVIPSNYDDIKCVLKISREENLPLYIIGAGTNLLVRDSGIKGIVLKIADTLNDVIINGNKVISGAGIRLSKLLSIVAKEGLTGLEFAAGIPGTLSGAIAMNAGSSLGSMDNVINEVAAIGFSGSICTLSQKECRFGYRESIFQHRKMIILKSKITLRKGKREKIQERIKEIIEMRKRKQPLDKPNAGCIFRNPKGCSAGELIEKAGLKGKRINDAQVSMVHANFIVNLGRATANDVLTLINLIQKEVASKFGIFLEREIIVIP